MQINVSQQLKAPVGSVRNYEVKGTIDIAGSERAVRGEVSLIRINRGLLVKGTLRTDLEATCSRCLGSFSCPLVLDIEEEYFPVTDIVSGAPLVLPEEPGYFTIDEHHILDLTEALRQCALLAMPMRPLCREDCAGLCPTCGHNLNQGACGCSHREIDPRWAKLSKLASSGGILVKGRKGSR